jgi:hypothetical protein
MATAASGSSVTAAKASVTAVITMGTARGDKNNAAATSANRPAGGPQLARPHRLVGDTMLALTYISEPHLRCRS